MHVDLCLNLNSGTIYMRLIGLLLYIGIGFPCDIYSVSRDGSMLLHHTEGHFDNQAGPICLFPTMPHNKINMKQFNK